MAATSARPAPVLPTGRLDDRRARPEQPAALGVVDDVHGDAVLHRAAGVQVLELDVDVALDVSGDLVELDDRRLADGVENGGARALHHGLIGYHDCARDVKLGNVSDHGSPDWVRDGLRQFADEVRCSCAPPSTSRSSRRASPPSGRRAAPRAQSARLSRHRLRRRRSGQRDLPAPRQCERRADVAGARCAGALTPFVYYLALGGLQHGICASRLAAPAQRFVRDGALRRRRAGDGGAGRRARRGLSPLSSHRQARRQRSAPAVGRGRHGRRDGFVRAVHGHAVDGARGSAPTRRHPPLADRARQRGGAAGDRRCSSRC